MPIKYIEVPEPIEIQDPVTKEKRKEKYSFAELVRTLLSNPMWMQSYANVKAADAITRALEKTNGVMELSEEDWKLLNEAKNTPRQVIINPGGFAQTIEGYGFHPFITPQLLPFLNAIDRPLDAPPKEEKKDE